MSEEKKAKKKPAPNLFYGLIQHREVVDGEDGLVTKEIVADKKSTLFELLGEIPEEKDIKILMLIKGRKITLKKKTSYQI